MLLNVVSQRPTCNCSSAADVSLCNNYAHLLSFFIQSISRESLQLMLLMSHSLLVYCAFDELLFFAEHVLSTKLFTQWAVKSASFIFMITLANMDRC